MKSYYYLLTLVAYIISFLIFFNIGLKLDIEKFISGKKFRRIGLFLFSYLFGIIGYLIIGDLNLAKEYQTLIDSFVASLSTAILVWALPVKLNK